MADADTTGFVRAVGWAAGPRRLAFTSANADIVLEIQPQPDHVLRVSGQVMSRRSAPAGWCALLVGQRAVARAGCDELGEFAFEAVPPGAYHVTLSSDSVLVELPLIELAPA